MVLIEFREQGTGFMHQCMDVSLNAHSKLEVFMLWLPSNRAGSKLKPRIFQKTAVHKETGCKLRVCKPSIAHM